MPRDARYKWNPHSLTSYFPQPYTGDSQEILGIEKGARELPLGTGGGQGIRGERNKALSISPGLSFRQSKNLKLLGEGQQTL